MDECAESVDCITKPKPGRITPVTGHAQMAQECNGRLVCESMSTILDEIMTALTQPNIMILGLYGSTSNERKHVLVEQITRRVERDGVFDVLMMATVVENNMGPRGGSRSPNVGRIQEELGNKLGLQLQHITTLQQRARCLSDGIRMKAKILIILDNVRGGINLAQIGIPFGNDHNGCKILLVAGTEEVLSNQMNAPQRTISLLGL
ncbi:Disease resistance protein RFL1 [Spatholobus suberectus]|nr:Disease resistance protein RFL1 [Spatholobus suberectus]